MNRHFFTIRILLSGIWGEFRDRIRRHYGGADSVATGWVSHTLFEPHVGNQIFNQMLDEFPNILRIHGYYIVKALVDNNRVNGAAFINKNGDTLKINARMSIDATEYGDLMALSGANYFVGLDSKELTNEEIAPVYGNSIIQDLTYTVILKDYGPGADMTIPRPPNYQPSIFLNACKELSEKPEEFDGVDCETMLNYARLPNNKYLINWPNFGNDYFLNVLEMGHQDREKVLEEAKNRTKQFIYFLQTEGGFKNLGIADDEFDTADGFPYIAYHRESRRLDGLTMLTMNELIDPYNPETHLYKTAIGVGDYPLDHHRKLNPSPPDSLLEEGDREPYEFETHFDAFPPIPSFSVPLGSLIPKTVDGLIVAEKSISVSSIANGSSRLQPVVMTIGQAAGVTATLAIKEKTEPRNISVRKVQQRLLNENAWLLPFMDTVPDDWYAWANQTKIYPDSVMTYFEVEEALKISIDREIPVLFDMPSDNPASRSDVIEAVWKIIGSPEPDGNPKLSGFDLENEGFKAIQFAMESAWTKHWFNPEHPDAESPIRRKEFAQIVDTALDPFHNLTVSIIPKTDKNN